MCVSSPVVCWYVDFYVEEKIPVLLRVFKVVLQESDVYILFAVCIHKTVNT